MNHASTSLSPVLFKALEATTALAIKTLFPKATASSGIIRIGLFSMLDRLLTDYRCQRYQASGHSGPWTRRSSDRFWIRRALYTSSQVSWQESSREVVLSDAGDRLRLATWMFQLVILRTNATRQ